MFADEQIFGWYYSLCTGLDRLLFHQETLEFTAPEFDWPVWQFKPTESSILFTYYLKKEDMKKCHKYVFVNYPIDRKEFATQAISACHRLLKDLLSLSQSAKKEIQDKESDGWRYLQALKEIEDKLNYYPFGKDDLDKLLAQAG